MCQISFIRTKTGGISSESGVGGRDYARLGSVSVWIVAHHRHRDGRVATHVSTNEEHFY
jgi:hypothetical protein